MGENKQIEQKRVDEVREQIAGEISKLEQETSKRKDEVVHIRKYFWDEVKINTDTFDDYLETILGLRQEHKLWPVKAAIRQASKRLATLKRMEQSPYFGRIDLREEGADRTEQIYIGIAALMDESGEDFLVYDWRAPVSSVYYDYQPGAVSYETPGGTVNGVLEKKMQFLIEGGHLQSLFDTSLTIGDEILQQVLGKGSNKQMQSIVATIQQEQNEVIRHERSRLLVVHGAAGSGKTSAALQRIAYLLYRNRHQLNADQIILFSPNTMFNRYVANVLPELGEETMQQVTFQAYLNRRLGQLFDLEEPYDQLEYVLTAPRTSDYAARVAAIEYKASIPFFDAVNAYRQSLEHKGMVFSDLLFRGNVLISRHELDERFYGTDVSLGFHNRLEKLLEWLIKEVKQRIKAEYTQPWVEEEMQLLSEEKYRKAHRYLAKKTRFKRADTADYEMEDDALARLLVHQKVKPLLKEIRAYSFINIKAIYKQLFQGEEQLKRWTNKPLPSDWEAICVATVAMIDSDRLAYEDATPYLYLQELIQGFQVNRAIKQIVVDEAQDYSPFQFEFLKQLFPATKMTVLGDFNQAIFSHAQETSDFHSLTSLYGPDKTKLIPITRSYRSTKPIIELTRRLVPNGDQIIPFERDGAVPTLTRGKTEKERHAQMTDQINQLKERGFSSIAVICQSAAESKNAHEALSEHQELKLIVTSSTEYEQGTVVIPTYLAKGMEFDAVILYDTSVYQDESVRRLFYTACTRAMHELHLFSLGEDSRFLQRAIRDGVLIITKP
ncbi:LOW QUALITY PROTEIN: helicase, UvrD/Rep family [Bacillus sp. JCM 19046]|nr:LOW QUALITY PROTEIN: helicase, UvrD/Rep family [Bacillus sp. JCM 19046]